MVRSVLLSMLLFFVLSGCATPLEIEKGRDVQFSLVENLHLNHKVISSESIALYEKQAKEDVEFIYHAIKEEDPEKALEIRNSKRAIIDGNVAKLKNKVTQNEVNFVQYKRLQEALK